MSQGIIPEDRTRKARRRYLLTLGSVRMVPESDALLARIRPALPLPLSETGESALQHFLALPGVASWNPDNIYLAELSMIFDLGLPFALLGNNSSADYHRRELGKTVASRAALPVSVWSEVQA